MPRTRRLIIIPSSGFDLRPEELEELLHPRRMSRPGGGRDQVSIDEGVRVGLVRLAVVRPRGRDLGAYGRVAHAAPSLQDTGRGEDLRPVADRRHGLVLLEEVTRDIEDARVQP